MNDLPVAGLTAVFPPSLACLAPGSSTRGASVTGVLELSLKSRPACQDAEWQSQGKLLSQENSCQTGQCVGNGEKPNLRFSETGGEKKDNTTTRCSMADHVLDVSPVKYEWMCL